MSHNVLLLRHEINWSNDWSIKAAFYSVQENCTRQENMFQIATFLYKYKFLLQVSWACVISIRLSRVAIHFDPHKQVLHGHHDTSATTELECILITAPSTGTGSYYQMNFIRLSCIEYKVTKVKISEIVLNNTKKPRRYIRELTNHLRLLSVDFSKTFVLSDETGHRTVINAHLRLNSIITIIISFSKRYNQQIIIKWCAAVEEATLNFNLLNVYVIKFVKVCERFPERTCI